MTRKLLWSGSIMLLLLVIAGWQLAAPARAYYHLWRGSSELEKALQQAGTQTKGYCLEPRITDAVKFREIENASFHLMAAIRFSPRLARASLLAARAYCWLGEWENATINYQAYTELRPENPLGAIELGYAYQKLSNKLNEPNLISEDLPDDQELPGIPENMQKAVEAWRAGKVNPLQFKDAGDRRLQAGLLPEAMSWYERALWMDPNSAQTWLQVGKIHENNGDLTKAEFAYRRAVKSDPEQSVEALSRLLMNNGDDQAAADATSQALAEFPDSPNRLAWWGNLGEALRNQKDWEQAIKIYRKALAEFPDRPELHINLGWAYYQNTKDYDTAYAEFEKAISLNDKGANGYYAIGQLLTSEGRFVDADEWYFQAVYRNPNRVDYQLARSDNLVKAGELGRAIEVLQEAIQRLPNEARFYFRLALAYKEVKQPAEAVLATKKALELSPKPSISELLQAAGILEWAGETEKALNLFQQILNEKPNNQAAKDGIERLSPRP